MTEVTLTPIADTNLDESEPDENHGFVMDMYVGNTAGSRRRALVNFDLTKIPSGVVILGAMLRVYAVSGDAINHQTFGTHRVTSTWAEMTVTWNTAPTFDPAPTDTKTPIERGKWYEFDVTSIIQHQYGTPAERFGIMIRGSEDTTQLTGIPAKEWIGGKIPELVVIYAISGAPLENLTVRLSHHLIPSGKSIKVWIKNETGIRLVDAVLHFGAQTRTIGTIEPYTLRTIELGWDYLEPLPDGMPVGVYTEGWNEAKTLLYISNIAVFRVTAEPEKAVIQFTDTKALPHHPSTLTLIDKTTGETWDYDSDTEGKFRVPKPLVTGNWAIHLVREKAPTKELAIGVLDPYDWKDYVVKSDLARRHIITLVLKPESMTTFSQIISQHMPPFLKGVVDILAGVFGWVSTQVYNLTSMFFGSYLTTVSGGKVVNVEYDFEKGEIRVNTVVMYGSPIVITTAILLAILAVVGIAIIGATIAYSKYSDARIEELKTERMTQYSETVETLSKLVEEGKISEETFKESVGALTEYSDRLEASTPTPTWMEYIPTILIVGLVGVIVVVMIWYATRRAR